MSLSVKCIFSRMTCKQLIKQARVEKVDYRVATATSRNALSRDINTGPDWSNKAGMHMVHYPSFKV